MYKKVFAIIFSFIIFAMCFSSTLFAIHEEVAGTESIKTVSYDETKDYPLTGAPRGAKTSVKVAEKTILDRIEGYQKEIEQKVTTKYPYNMTFVLMNKSFLKMMGIDATTSVSTEKQAFNEGIVDIGDNHLSLTLTYAGEEKENTTQNIDKLVSFGQEMKEQKIPMLVFMPPSKLNERTEIQSGIYHDYTVEQEKLVIEELRDAGMNVLAISEIIEKEQMDTKEMFFETDHHWLPQTALWADRLLCDYMNQNMGFNLDTHFLADENYTIEYVEQPWLGSLGKKTTEIYNKLEKFPMLLPKYESDVTVFYSKTNETLTGSINEVLLDPNWLKEEDIYLRDNYYYYIRGNMSLIKIHNNKIENGKRVLLIKWSMANAMVPYLATVFEDIDVIDLRAYKGSLKSYIGETSPDAVIAVYGSNGFAGYNEGFDFR